MAPQAPHAHHHRLQSTTTRRDVGTMMIASADMPPSQQAPPPAPALPPQKPLPRASALVAAATHPPRPPTKHRPQALDLSIASSNGHSTLPTPRLKRMLCAARSPDDVSAIVQVPAADHRERLPPTPTTPLASLVMGNAHSNASDSVDATSLRSVVRVRRHSRPTARKSSSNLFRHIDSRSPLSRDVTASVMSILHRDGTKNDTSPIDTPMGPCDDITDADDPGYRGCLPTLGPFCSPSTVTMTESRANPCPSASTTDSDQDLSAKVRKDSKTEPFPNLEPAAAEGEEAIESLSPSIPAPSPLPEDSPHKYGLRDSADTPPVPYQGAHVQTHKAKRKSSGLEIFKEAQTLQQAQSFLNGLSTARRRAESTGGARATKLADESLCDIVSAERGPGSTRPSSHPIKRYEEGVGRHKGHNFKSSGFAYSRPLTLAQIQCYRAHATLLQSRNKHAPVECAVCHADDESEHFSCSWCALRMCRHCRKEFAVRGFSALRERIKTAEMGSVMDCEQHRSSESVPDCARAGSS
ncbi:hypothetical protein CERZMDRAFT_100607 [Cercospora zeae-maydis SCOH1-5]|uniref:Uncharacterized protein n=1 Tax=Cercospora zeae-maydis SCOH1-5 TaxID=717836 RepID=A0A6A6F6I9_9PEZI|nr:hypothetical protein CERZMDRAFT_100607 [Cercospora zeae-maydis SCOH1-5]